MENVLLRMRGQSVTGAKYFLLRHEYSEINEVIVENLLSSTQGKVCANMKIFFVRSMKAMQGKNVILK